jgi:hypothetical protein
MRGLIPSPTLAGPSIPPCRQSGYDDEHEKIPVMLLFLDQPSAV